MANQKTYQFTLGPVQGFVAQARRTRDFWAGSFILSWLSGVAMCNIEQQGGTILFPAADQNFLSWLKGEQPENSDRPLQGCIPNRFKAMTATVPLDFKPEHVADAVKAAWLGVCDIVWKDDLSSIANQKTKAIWDRQTQHFWEISWVLSDSDGRQLLDRRKNWRNTVAPEEPGHKCMMMDGWQELSGVLNTNLKEVNAFWDDLSKQLNTLDLRPGEHLCAIAFVKRRFAHSFHKVAVSLPLGYGTIHGWDLPVNVPSTAFLAAAPWLAEVIRHTSNDSFDNFHQACKTLDVSHSEIEASIDIRCVYEAANKPGFKRRWAGLDGQVYFPSALQNVRLFENQAAAKTVLTALNQLKASANLDSLPSPYYAVLMMDGDQLGVHMGNLSLQTPISNALNHFTKSVASCVDDHNGFLVYAGGDDVLALFPLEHVMTAANALQKSYRASFEEHAPAVGSTLSGAIEFAHFRTPLTTVLKDAHHLLDDVAKEKTGRNALAIRVWKPAGLALEWRMPWQKALDADGALKLLSLVDRFRSGEVFSNKFVFRIQDIINRTQNLSLDVLTELLTVEFHHSFGGKNASAYHDDLKALLDQSLLWERSVTSGQLEHSTPMLQSDTALLVRFLVQKGLDKEFA